MPTQIGFPAGNISGPVTNVGGIGTGGGLGATVDDWILRSEPADTDLDDWSIPENVGGVLLTFSGTATQNQTLTGIAARPGVPVGKRSRLRVTLQVGDASLLIKDGDPASLVANQITTGDGRDKLLLPGQTAEFAFINNMGTGFWVLLGVQENGGGGFSEINDVTIAGPTEIGVATKALWTNRGAAVSVALSLPVLASVGTGHKVTVMLTEVGQALNVKPQNTASIIHARGVFTTADGIDLVDREMVTFIADLDNDVWYASSSLPTLAGGGGIGLVLVDSDELLTPAPTMTLTGMDGGAFHYRAVFSRLVMDSANAADRRVDFRLGDAGGIFTSNIYEATVNRDTSLNTTYTADAYTTIDRFRINGTNGMSKDETSHKGGRLVVDIFDPQETQDKFVEWEGNIIDSTGRNFQTIGRGRLKTTDLVDRIQLFANAENMADGLVGKLFSLDDGA